jgi:geranylgeranyl pyrophosphate synthase
MNLKLADAWMVPRLEEVLAECEARALGLARSDSQRALLRPCLAGLRAQANAWNPPARRHQANLPHFIYLPLFVHAGLCGDDRPAIPLAAATSLLFLGVDIFDDVADGDCRVCWDAHGETEMNLAAATLLCSIPQLIIADLPVPSDRRCAMQRTVAEGLLRMSAGQQGDLSFVDAQTVEVDDLIASVVSKSGEEVGMFAQLAAELAEATPAQHDAYTAFGRAIGTAGQLASDCYELFHEATARDLVHGARTLPIALHLERLAGRDRTNFLSLLDRARYDGDSRTAVRDTLRATGVLRLCAFVVETYCLAARRALKQAAPRAPAFEGLRMMIDGITFFPEGDTR